MKNLTEKNLYVKISIIEREDDYQILTIKEALIIPEKS